MHINLIEMSRTTTASRRMEDIDLLETALAKPQMQVFILQSAADEFDMGLGDQAAVSCELFVIKHSTEIVSEQTHHLTRSAEFGVPWKVWGAW